VGLRETTPEETVSARSIGLRALLAEIGQRITSDHHHHHHHQPLPLPPAPSATIDCGKQLLKIQEILSALRPNNTSLCNLNTSGGKTPRILNLLKPTGYVMHQQFSIQQLYALPTLYLCVLYLSENKQRLVPLTA
jgi:hypothetical protein